MMDGNGKTAIANYELEITNEYFYYSFICDFQKGFYLWYNNKSLLFTAIKIQH